MKSMSPQRMNYNKINSRPDGHSKLPAGYSASSFLLYQYSVLKAAREKADSGNQPSISQNTGKL